ncbi:MAG: smc, partial [Nocardioidaceae bacterium]|nr:smc [Nocardioidaceae bacterium]
MYLKSLTLRGFKSFASTTTLQLEPGITCVVGPNGSGKSNVVDALSWVMGEQGAKTLRGGKMEDVIFAGTSGRPPLGRAEVVLTIDNTDGALPIEYTEVTISRTMFRNGGSEYALNGNPCRLLDVQELLSDSGIGREMHVIVGQGQLDGVLRATPEERRGFVEEAAGVLKHRKRKEKAMRKLDSTQGNLTRLQDLLNELRRQLKPLGRQAEVARRAAVIQADVRDARARLLADDIATATGLLTSELADESALKERRQNVEASLETLRADETNLEQELRDDAPRLSMAQETWFSLSGLRERMRGTLGLANERVRLASVRDDDDRHGRDPDDLEEDARRVAAQEAELLAEVEAAKVRLAEIVERRAQAEASYQGEERRVAGLLRAAADRREGLARLHGQVNALKSRAAAADEELGRLAAGRAQAETRATEAQREFTSLETQVAGLDAGESGLDEEHEIAQEALTAVSAQVDAARERAQTADRERAALLARKEALELGVARRDGAGALLAASDKVSGMLGSVAALLTVRSGYEAAVASALGTAADAVAVEHVASAVEALQVLRSDDLGRAGLLLGGSEIDDSRWPGLPGSASYAIGVVEAPDALRGALRRLLFKVAIVDDLREAQALISQTPDVVAVTRDGDLLGAHFASGGSASKQSLIEVQAALDKATADLGEATATLERTSFELSGLLERKREAELAVEDTLARLHESDATMAAVAEKLGHLGSLVRSSRGEADRMAAAMAEAEAARVRDLDGLAELEDRLTQAEVAPDEEPDTTLLDSLADDAAVFRRDETDARLALRTGEERSRNLHGQADALRRSAAAEREARIRALERRERQQRETEVARAVIDASDVVMARLDVSIEAASAQRALIERVRTERDLKMSAIRSEIRTLTGELDKLTDSVHRDEMARAEQRLRIEALEQRAQEELGLGREELLGEYGPDVLVPPSLVAEGDTEEDAGEREPIPFVREHQAKRLRTAERALAMLGKVNPLALEEFTALEERHQFLSDQLDDLRRTRQDLLDIVSEVDAKVQQVFTDAWFDTEREFADVFSRLFPGGEG